MDNSDKSLTKRAFRALRLRQERGRRGWSQSELARILGTTQVNVSRWEKGMTIPGPYFRQRLGDVFDKSLEDLGLLLVGVDEDESSNSPPVDASQPLVRPFFWIVPYRRNLFFTGREDILTALHTLLTSNQTAALTQAQAISGLGGIGKTQTAIEYAYRFREHYQAVLWATASTRDTLIADVVRLAAHLNLPERFEQDQDIVVRAVKRWLGLHQGWLLILDNVDDLALIADILPGQGAGHVLLTTRLQAVGSLAHSIEVEKMGLEEGVMFLLRRTKQLAPGQLFQSSAQSSLAEEIVLVLDGLPLALDQAGAYIEETRCGFSTYLELYHTRRQVLLQRRGRVSTDHPEPVATTWALSFRQVKQEDPAAADLLRLLAFLDPEAIPEEILIEGACELGTLLGPAVADPLERNAAMAVLLHYSLMRRDPEKKILNIHRLVQAVLKDAMSKEQQKMWTERALRAINRAFPDVELSTWDQCLRCLPHVQHLSNAVKEYDLAYPEVARLLNQAANYLSTHGRYAEAEPLLQQALTIYKHILDPSDPATASTLSDLGRLYLSQGKYQQADPLLEQALAIRALALGQKHPETAASLNNLALLYCAQGKYDRADELFQQALQLRQSMLNPGHPDIAQSLNNLAELYTERGSYEQAESLYLEAWASQEKALGRFHPDVATTLNNLALLYRKKGEYIQAEDYYEQALTIQKHILGNDHPALAQTLYNMGRLYRAQGDYEKAEPYYKRALQIREEVFGPDHPMVAQSLHGLAKLYYSQWDFAQAEEVARQALSIQDRRLGSDHPDIAYTLATLAKICYFGQKKLDESETLLVRALRIREHTSDAHHPHIAHICNNLTDIYHLQGKYREAQPLIARSLQLRPLSLGANHPYMAYDLMSMGENLFLQGDYSQAEAFFKQALANRELNLGSEHPQTAITHDHLARVYTAQGRYAEAEELYRKILDIREQVFGLEHSAIADTLKPYALLLRKQGRGQEAEAFERRSNTIRAKYVKPGS